MKIDDIMYDGDKLGQVYWEAVAYLNEKFDGFTPDQIKEWLEHRGTMLIPTSNDEISKQIILMEDSKEQAIFIIYIEECLLALSQHFKIKDQRYHEL